MMVMALDPSLTAFGIAGCKDGHIDVWTVKPEGRGVSRLDAIEDKIVGLCRGADLVVIEGYSYGSKGRSVVSLGELGGVIRLGLYRSGFKVVEVPPSSMKKYATGRGNAPKDEVLVSAVTRLGYKGHDKNEADALWLLQMAMGAYGLEGAVDVPKVHQEGQEKVQWPKI